ncbi:hypothetical protein PAMP_020630 [Pampus punctatissimus]
MELSDDPRLRWQEEAPLALLPCLSQMNRSSYRTVQQQGFSAPIFLRRKDKLEQTQQKCIAIFALVCCFAVLVVLIFSSVDIWDDEDGITEENCSRNCRIVLVENLPDDLAHLIDGRPHLPLSVGFHTLLDQAQRSVEVVSPVWDLNSWELETMASTAKQRKELGLMVYNCSCLALDLHRVFSFYWQLHERDYIPSIWSKRVTALYGKHNALQLQLNATQATAYVSTSPALFCSKDRTRDVDAIYQVMQSAKTFIFISVTDYLPLVSRSFRGTSVTRYWSPIDEMIREAVVLRGVRVRLLISFWKKTHPLTFNFVTSLKSLCMHLHNCSLEVKFFSHKEQKDDIQHGLNHNKYMVTDNALYIGNHDWVGSDFAINAGAGLVVKMKKSTTDSGVLILEQLKAAFERDWRSRYAKSLQGSKDQDSKYRNLQLEKSHVETKEGNKWNNPLSL